MVMSGYFEPFNLSCSVVVYIIAEACRFSVNVFLFFSFLFFCIFSTKPVVCPLSHFRKMHRQPNFWAVNYSFSELVVYLM